MSIDLISKELSQTTFDRISKVVYDIAGIYLPPTKIGLVKSRLLKRLRLLNMETFEEYIEYVLSDKTSKELGQMIDIITTNKTNFFREIQHFNLMSSVILPNLVAANSPIRIWSAGCSSGAEPYTIAMVLNDVISDIARRDVKILATDISYEMLEIAKKGTYPEVVKDEVTDKYLKKGFVREVVDGKTMYTANNYLKNLVKFAYLNLMNDWPMKGPFQIIFCRNVMIYFDKETRQRLINRFYSLLAPNGYLFVGHSESLTSSEHNFTYIQPAVYQKRV